MMDRVWAAYLHLSSSTRQNRAKSSSGKMISPILTSCITAAQPASITTFDRDPQNPGLVVAQPVCCSLHRVVPCLLSHASSSCAQTSTYEGNVPRALVCSDFPLEVEPLSRFPMGGRSVCARLSVTPLHEPSSRAGFCGSSPYPPLRVRGPGPYRVAARM